MFFSTTAGSFIRFLKILYSILSMWVFTVLCMKWWAGMFKMHFLNWLIGNSLICFKNYNHVFDDTALLLITLLLSPTLGLAPSPIRAGKNDLLFIIWTLKKIKLYPFHCSKQAVNGVNLLHKKHEVECSMPAWNIHRWWNPLGFGKTWLYKLYCAKS